ncbi:MAG: hypothetical protein HGGPFJEG_01558 [Ignavibacteria bacterium]|nr:hypothetical protein [Ignavibacteria bacterium]
MGLRNRSLFDKEGHVYFVTTTVMILSLKKYLRQDGSPYATVLNRKKHFRFHERF